MEACCLNWKKSLSIEVIHRGRGVLCAGSGGELKTDGTIAWSKMVCCLLLPLFDAYGWGHTRGGLVIPEERKHVCGGKSESWFTCWGKMLSWGRWKRRHRSSVPPIPHPPPPYFMSAGSVRRLKNDTHNWFVFTYNTTIVKDSTSIQTTHAPGLLLKLGCHCWIKIPNIHSVGEMSLFLSFHPH